MTTESTKHYNLTAAQALESLRSSPRGLSTEEAQRRLAGFGPNELQEKKQMPQWRLFLQQYQSFLMYILLFAVVLTLVIGEYVDSIVIAVILLFCGVLGFFQERRAERAMEALKRMAAPTATAIRDGQRVEIPARELVPGDIVLIEAGDRIPADCRLVEVANLKMDEAPLTGESVPVDKTTEALPGELPVGDRKNLGYAGTAATYGRGTAVIVDTGMKTEFGKIAGMLQEVEERQTPLQENLNRVGKWLGIACLSICAVVAILGIVVRGHGVLEMLIWGIALAVAAVPEALPAIVTISLAIGASRMVKRHALIRKLTAVETLGSTMVICSDKTGTLTENQMTVRRLYVNGKMLEVSGAGYEPRGEFYLNGVAFDPVQDAPLQRLFHINALCNDSALADASGTWSIKGDPTEGALTVVAAKAGVWPDKLAGQFPRVGEVPFSSERKRMTTVHDTPQGKVAYSKGAPEVILSSCTRLCEDGQERELTAQDRARILEMNTKMAEDALRVLGMAYKPLPNRPMTDAELEQDMVFVGIAGMIDPPREEVKEAIKVCDGAGIKSVMITGDHKLTAMAIARELGMLKQGVALSGTELDALSDPDFDNMVEKVEVYARVSPAHKARVVDAFLKKDYVIAMTGDGVNDAPALKKADIGIAMGITGTDVTKEASDMVLTDDNFASIVAAVEEGRGIFGNIKKYLMYLLSCNIGEILLMLIAILIGLPLPLVAIQILWVNLATDGLPALALSVDPPDPDIMKQPPRGRKEGIFTKPVMVFLGIIGLWTGVASLLVFLWSYRVMGKPVVEAQSLCFITLIMIEFFNALNCRSERHSIVKAVPWANKWLVWALAGSMAMSAAVIVIPALQGPFHTHVLSGQEWLVAVSAAATTLVVGEIVKFVTRRRYKP